MYSRVFTNEKCPCSGQVQQVTVYFEDTATNGIRDLNNYKRHHFVCDNKSCPAQLEFNSCPIFNYAHA